MIQAHAFKAGLEFNGSDKSLKQAFWDSVNLMVQTKEAGPESLEMEGKGLLLAANHEGTLMNFPAAGAAIADL